VPSTPFNAPVSAQRSFAFASVAVRDIRAVRSAFGCTDNDVVLALCAAVLRQWLIGKQALPEVPLVVGVPASLRGRSGTARGGDATAGGNRVSLMVVPLPTQEVEPAQRLRAISAAMLIAKRRLAAMPEDWLTDITDLVPAPLAGVAARSVGRVVHSARWHPVNLVISHVPGPQVPLYLAGAKMLAHYPISAVSDALGGLNITVVGHDGDLDFGFVACPRLVPDVWGLAAALPGAIRELLDCAPAI
jgi:WS/DGAT/MGAT family acyltransferase